MARQRLTNVECIVLDMQRQSAVSDAAVDLVIGQMSLQYAEDKPKALREIFRVLKPGGVLLANVWGASEHVALAGELLSAVLRTPKDRDPLPNGPLGLADAAFFDRLLEEAGFELAADHNSTGTVSFCLGHCGSFEGFKMAALPIWYPLHLSKEERPDAWMVARLAYPVIARPYADADGIVHIKDSFRIAIARKPA